MKKLIWQFGQNSCVLYPIYIISGHPGKPLYPKGPGSLPKKVLLGRLPGGHNMLRPFLGPEKKLAA